MSMTRTATAQRADITTPLIKALAFAWASIQAKNPDVPNVVMTLGQGSGRVKNGLVLGHFAPHSWSQGENSVHELFIGGEGLERGAVAVMATLIHEAAHGVAVTRDVQDVSRGGRYHNRVFKMIAEGMGLEVIHDNSEPKSSSLGWSDSLLPEAGQKTYAAAIRKLDAAIVAYRRMPGLVRVPVAPGGPDAPVGPGMKGRGRKGSNNGLSLSCQCAKPRKIRIALATYELGPIVCQVCGAEFAPAE